MTEILPSEAIGFAFTPMVAFIDDMGQSAKQAVLSEIIVDEELAQGVHVIVNRAGLFKFVFNPESKGHISAVALTRTSNTPSDALQYRIKLLNAYLVCFYSAMAEEQILNTHPSMRSKMLLSPRNVILFRERYDDYGGRMGEGVITQCPDEEFYRDSNRKYIMSAYLRNSVEQVRAAMMYEGELDLLELLLIHP